MVTDGQIRNSLKKREVLSYLHQNVFDPILDSPIASEKLKQGIRLTIMRMNERDAQGIVQYYWSAVIGTERSVGFSGRMREEGFTRFEEIIEDFRSRFNDAWLRS